MSQAATLNWQPTMPDNRRMWLAIGVSLLFHGLLLMLHFQFPDASKTMREKALDIILVNAKSARKPSDAQALAQANLDGGGNTEEDRRAKTPLPPTKQNTAGDEVQQAQRRVQELEAAQRKMLTQAKSLRTVASTPTATEQPTPAPNVSGVDLLESAKAMARLEGEINRMTDEYSKKPRKKFVGARAEEYGLAAYLDAWKNKIERIGTLNYPEEARGKLYGSVVLFVELRVEDGSLYNVEVSRSSGHKVLDLAAQRILRMSAPFGPVPREAMNGATVLSFARTWYFTQGDALSTGKGQ